MLKLITLVCFLSTNIHLSKSGLVEMSKSLVGLVNTTDTGHIDRGAVSIESQEKFMIMALDDANRVLPALSGYGCWCYFDSNNGRGPPQDEADLACRRLQKGYMMLFNV